MAGNRLNDLNAFLGRQFFRLAHHAQYCQAGCAFFNIGIHQPV